MRPEPLELLPVYMILILPLPQMANSGPAHFFKENELILTCQRSFLLSSPIRLIDSGDGTLGILGKGSLYNSRILTPTLGS